MAHQRVLLRGVLAAVSGVAAVAVQAETVQADVGRAVFSERNNPPPYRVLSPSERNDYELGHAVFNTTWLPAGTPGADRRSGLGPLFNAASCDACHNEGARGRGPVGDGVAPMALVIQLAVPASDGSSPDHGVPVYGDVLNTQALPGVAPEGVVRIEYREINGRYADGTPWKLREPHYHLTDLSYGPLADNTIIKPRLAPPLFGVGLLQAVAGSDISSGAADVRNSAGSVGWWRFAEQGAGRFGWQASTATVREQTARAMSREMGLTSPDLAKDDCTEAQAACRLEPGADHPEVSEQLLGPLLSFLRWLAVPQVPDATARQAAAPPAVTKCQCTSCHRPQYSIMDRGENGVLVARTISPYSDLWRHDLGTALADRDLQGNAVQSRWRTAPLWGLGYSVRVGRDPTLLHDGRARSPEEAILWHGGEAAQANECFQALPAARRKQLLNWLESL